MNYVIQMHKMDDNLYSIECNTAIMAGKEKLLHNEISCCVEKIGKTFRFIGGYHIGAEDFTCGADDEWVLEKYHPGITAQIKELINKEESEDGESIVSNRKYKTPNRRVYARR